MNSSIRNLRISKSTYTQILAALTLAAICAPGCIEREIASQPTHSDGVVTHDFDLAQNRELDLLFVIDNSHSMAAEQRSLVENFGNFVARLEEIEGGLPNVHIGVVSTDVGVGDGNERSTCYAEGDRGRLWHTASPTCQAALPSDAFIRDVGLRDGSRNRNYPDGQSLTETFSCMAEIGITGCGYEQPLESMRQALDPANLANSGFLREDAYLAVVFITDEDDCSAIDTSLFGASQDALDDSAGRRRSFRCFEEAVICDGDPRDPGAKQNCRARDDSPYMQTVQEYADFLKELKGDENKVIVAGITGDPDPVEVYLDDDGDLDLGKSCGQVPGEPFSGAVPATRLSAFLDQFPYSTKTSLCDEDLSGALNDIGVLLAAVFDHRCLAGELADLDPATEGVQPECAVIETRYADTSYPQSYVLPLCDNPSDPNSASNHPCYAMTAETACSDHPSQLAISVFPEDREVPADTYLEVQCRVE